MKNNKPTNRLAACLLPYARKYLQHHSVLLIFTAIITENYLQKVSVQIHSCCLSLQGKVHQNNHIRQLRVSTMVNGILKYSGPQVLRDHGNFEHSIFSY